MGSGYGSRRKGNVFFLVKYLFIVFNVLVWLLGFGVLTVGIWMHLNRGPYVTLLPNSSFLSATTLTIAAGVIIFVVGFCGCVGAMMESQCMLVVYFIFVLVIFGLEVTATALGLTYKYKVQTFIRQEVLLSIKQDYDPQLADSQNKGVVAVVDNIQTDLECCGVDNLTDWFYIPAWPDKANVPMSCCVNPSQGCGEASSDAPWHTRGCMKEVEYWFMTRMYTMGILALSVAVIQVLAMAAAIGMFCCLRKDKFSL